MASNSSPPPGIGGGASPPPLPDARLPSNAPSGSAPRRPSTPTAGHLLDAGELAVVGAGSVHDEGPGRTTSARVYPVLGSPRASNSTAGAVEAEAVLGSTSAPPFPLPLLPGRRNPEIETGGGGSSSSSGRGSELSSTPAPSTSAAAYALGGDRMEPARRRRRFVEAPPTPRVAVSEPYDPLSPCTSTPARSTSSPGAHWLGSRRHDQGEVELGRRHPRGSPPTPHVSDSESESFFTSDSSSSFRGASTSAQPQSTSAAAYALGGDRMGPVRRRRRFVEAPPTPRVDGSEPYDPFFPCVSTPARSTSSTAAHVADSERLSPGVGDLSSSYPSTVAALLGSRRRGQGGAGDPNRIGRGSSPPPHVGDIEGFSPGDRKDPSSSDASTAAAYLLGSRRSGQGGAAQNERHPLGSPPNAWPVPSFPSVVWTAGLEGGVSAADARALELLVGRLHRALGSGAAAVGLWRFWFFSDSDAAATPSWTLVVHRDEQLVASWRVAAVETGGGYVHVPASALLGAAHGQGALASPAAAGRRRSAWDVPSRTCNTCRVRPVAWFLSCCGHLLCEACVRSGAGGCPCVGVSTRHLPVPFRPPYEPQPLRSLVLLRYPFWQIFYVNESAGMVIIVYYNAEEAYYSQSHGVRFQLHIFFMEGEAWTRRIRVRFTLPCYGARLRLFVREIFASDDDAAAGDA